MTALIRRADCLSDPPRYDLAAIKFIMRWPDVRRERMAK
jgi:hypothetical protein